MVGRGAGGSRTAAWHKEAGAARDDARAARRRGFIASSPIGRGGEHRRRARRSRRPAAALESEWAERLAATEDEWAERLAASVEAERQRGIEAARAGARALESAGERLAPLSHSRGRAHAWARRATEAEAARSSERGGELRDARFCGGKSAAAAPAAASSHCARRAAAAAAAAVVHRAGGDGAHNPAADAASVAAALAAAVEGERARVARRGR